MKFKLDENLPIETADLFRAAGYEADTVSEEGLSGATDAELAIRVQHEIQAIVTMDLDFSDIRAYPPADYSGIIVLRPKTQDKFTVLHLVQRLLPLLSTEPLAGNLWIVEIDRVRIR